MRRRIVVPRHASVAIALCAVTALACTKSRQTSDTVTATARSAALVGTAAPSTVPTPPGALPKPLDSLSGEELYTFTHQLKFGGGVEKERKCKGAPECSAVKPMKTKIRVDAVDGQDSLSVTALPANGVVAVQARNNGAFVDAYYSMKPEKNMEYYLVVLPGTDQGGRWRLEQLDTTPNKRAHTQVASGTFKPCMHTFVPHKVNRANFYTCADAHMMQSDSVSKSGLALQGDDPPIWLDCAQGCCTASSP